MLTPPNPLLTPPTQFLLPPPGLSHQPNFESPNPILTPPTRIDSPNPTLTPPTRIDKSLPRLEPYTSQRRQLSTTRTYNRGTVRNLSTNIAVTSRPPFLCALNTAPPTIDETLFVDAALPCSLMFQFKSAYYLTFADEILLLLSLYELLFNLLGSKEISGIEYACDMNTCRGKSKKLVLHCCTSYGTYRDTERFLEDYGPRRPNSLARAIKVSIPQPITPPPDSSLPVLLRIYPQPIVPPSESSLPVHLRIYPKSIIHPLDSSLPVHLRIYPQPIISPSESSLPVHLRIYPK
ncbi:hypothetical protein J6590_017021 [Homalodisca vitripennis]|nr:hypothetical protein J6590_017021 [Homalodisca vitripennis]